MIFIELHHTKNVCYVKHVSDFLQKTLIERKKCHYKQWIIWHQNIFIYLSFVDQFIWQRESEYIHAIQNVQHIYKKAVSSIVSIAVRESI